MKLGAQLYSVRTRIKTPEDYVQTLAQLKKSGYQTVQHAGPPVPDAIWLRDVTQQAGMQQVCPNFDADVLVNDTNRVIEACRILGCDSIMLPYITPDDFVTLRSFLEAWASLEGAAQKLLDAGIAPTYHNHDFDVAPMPDWDGSFVEFLLENRPGWRFILDVCWASYAQADVEGLFRKIGGRMDSVHFKDYTGAMNSRHVPVFCACGSGVVQLERYANITRQQGIEHVIVEQDNAIAYPEPFQPMAESAAYLKTLF